MYTIHQAAERTGISESLLRAWERRYGVVAPARSAGGYRLYDDAAIARLRAMRQLVEAGWSAAQAAEAVASAPVGGDAGGTASPIFDPGGAEALVLAAMAYDAVGIEQALDEMFGRGSFEAVADDHLLPAVAALGSAWAAGRLDVAAEHLASEAVQRRLASLFDHAAVGGDEPGVIVGLPEGSRHEIGTLAFAVALRRRGSTVLYLGPDTPPASWAHVALDRGPRAIVIGVPTTADIGPAREAGGAVHAAPSDVLVAFGGPGARAAAEGVGIELPSRVTDAASEVTRLIRTRPA